MSNIQNSIIYFHFLFSLPVLIVIHRKAKKLE